MDNYEKAYKDALKKAMIFHNQAVDGDNPIQANRYEQIFPELREDEDEKIRKGLSRFLWRVANGEVKSMPSASQCQEWLSYLEKQKINTEGDFGRGYNCGYEACLNSHGAEWFEKQEEQKKPNIELIQKSWYMEGYHDGMFDFEPMWIIKTGEEGPRYEKNPNYGKPLPKEQKPGTTEDNPIDPFDTKLFQDGVKEGRRLEREDMQKEPFSCGHENGSSEKPNNQWSEEDERTINDACCWLAEYAGFILRDNKEKGTMIYKLLQKLKSLRPSWKPSKNEQTLINTITERMLEEGPIPTLKGKEKADFEKEFNRFKQICGFVNWPAREEIYKRVVLWFIGWSKDHFPKLGREHGDRDNPWKPSEEQMEALKHYVDTTTDGEIELLYNDLKKLI